LLLVLCRACKGFYQLLSLLGMWNTGETDVPKTTPFLLEWMATGMRIYILILRKLTEDNGRVISNVGRFDVRSDPQSSRSEACSFAVTIGGQAGRQYSPVNTCYRDNLDLDYGVTSTHILTYFFQDRKLPFALPDNKS